MEITKLSTKGQVVIPEQIRKGIKEGTAFSITRTEGLIVLKKVEGLTEQEIKEMKELDKIWKDVDAGKGNVQKLGEFLKEMENW